MFSFRKTTPQPIGVDIAADAVRLLQLEAHGEAKSPSLSVIAAAQTALAPEVAEMDLKGRTAAAADAIRQMLRKTAFSSRHMVAALPVDIVHTKNLRLPPMPHEELQAAIEFEARNIFPFDPDDAVVQFLNAGEVRQGTDLRQEVIVLAVRNQDIDTYLCELHASGAIIESLEFQPSAIYRSVERFIRRRDDEQEVHVLVDVGPRRTQVMIGRGRDLSFYKSIDIGGHHLHESVARKLSISVVEAAALRRRLIEAAVPTSLENDSESDKSVCLLEPESDRRESVRQAVHDATRSTMEQLARELSLCLRYYSVTFRGQRPSRVRLIGGEAVDPQLHLILGAGLTVPVESGRPLHNVNTSNMRPSDRRGYMSEWTVAFGLSLKRTTGTFSARDGKLRDADCSRAFGPGAQVIDLSAAIAATAPAIAPVPEVAHA